MLYTPDASSHFVVSGGSSPDPAHPWLVVDQSHSFRLRCKSCYQACKFGWMGSLHFVVLGVYEESVALSLLDWLAPG